MIKMGRDSYILRKNGEVIFNGENWDKMRSNIPNSIHSHKGDVYDLARISEEGENINISFAKNVGNTFLAFYNELNQGNYSNVSIPKVDLISLLESFGIQSKSP